MMIIEKNGKKYEVREYPKYWSVSFKQGALSVDFKLSKEICKSKPELKNYIEKEKMF